MWLFALHVTKSTLERLENGKQGLETGFEFINKSSVHRIVKNLNVRNPFEHVEKENSKYSLFFKLHLQNKYLREQYKKYFQKNFKPALH